MHGRPSKALQNQTSVSPLSNLSEPQVLTREGGQNSLFLTSFCESLTRQHRQPEGRTPALPLLAVKLRASYFSVRLLRKLGTDSQAVVGPKASSGQCQPFSLP